MSSVLSSVTGTDDEAESNRGTEETGTGASGGGSRRRNLGLAAAGLGTAYLLRRRRSGTQGSDSEGVTSATTGGATSDGSTGETTDSKGGRRFGGRVTKTVAGIAASVLVQRAIRRWRKR